MSVKGRQHRLPKRRDAQHRALEERQFQPYTKKGIRMPPPSIEEGLEEFDEEEDVL